MAYNPSVPPATKDDLLPYLQEEFFRISLSYNPTLEGQHEVLYRLPAKMRPGMICYFAGAGSPSGFVNEGLYRFTLAGTWIYIG